MYVYKYIGSCKHSPITIQKKKIVLGNYIKNIILCTVLSSFNT